MPPTIGSTMISRIHVHFGRFRTRWSSARITSMRQKTRMTASTAMGRMRIMWGSRGCSSPSP